MVRRMRCMCGRSLKSHELAVAVQAIYIFMSIKQTNQKLPLSWDEAKGGYLDRLDPDLLESVQSVDYSNPEEFYILLFKALCEQLVREIDRLRVCRKKYEEERAK